MTPAMRLSGAYNEKRGWAAHQVEDLMPGSERLPRLQRLARGVDYERVYARRCAVRDDLLQVCACPNGLAYSRVGLSVGRRWGSAVVRNRLRRLFREAFRLSKRELPAGLDLVLIPRRSTMELAELRSSLVRLARQAGRRLEHERNTA